MQEKLPATVLCEDLQSTRQGIPTRADLSNRVRTQYQPLMCLQVPVGQAPCSSRSQSPNKPDGRGGGVNPTESTGFKTDGSATSDSRDCSFDIKQSRYRAAYGAYEPFGARCKQVPLKIQPQANHFRRFLTFPIYLVGPVSCKAHEAASLGPTIFCEKDEIFSACILHLLLSSVQ